MREHPRGQDADANERPQDLEQTITHLLEEGRMILPGIQALFGFQMVAVFNTAFTALSPADKAVHLAATGLVALCVALVLAPVAFHRQVEPRGLSAGLATYSSWMLLISQALLMVALCLDFSVVAKLALRGEVACWALSTALLAVILTIWFIVPAAVRWRRRRRGGPANVHQDPRSAVPDGSERPAGGSPSK